MADLNLQDGRSGSSVDNVVYPGSVRSKKGLCDIGIVLQGR